MSSTTPRARIRDEGILVQDGEARIKVEVNTVLRGTVRISVRNLLPRNTGSGNSRTASRACGRNGLSAANIGCLGKRDQVFRVQLAARDKRTLPLAEVDFAAIGRLDNAFRPRVSALRCKSEKQALHLHASANRQQLEKTTGTEIHEARKKRVRMFYRFVLGNFVEEFENRLLGRRIKKIPIPRSPSLGAQATMHGVVSLCLSRFVASGQSRDLVTRAEKSVTVHNKLLRQFQFPDPRRQPAVAVKMDAGRAAWLQKMRVAAKFECREPANMWRAIEHLPQRIDDVLPLKRWSRPPVNAMSGRFQPSCLPIAFK